LVAAVVPQPQSAAARMAVRPTNHTLRSFTCPAQPWAGCITIGESIPLGDNLHSKVTKSTRQWLKWGTILELFESIGFSVPFCRPRNPCNDLAGGINDPPGSCVFGDFPVHSLGGPGRRTRDPLVGQLHQPGRPLLAGYSRRSPIPAFRRSRPGL